MDGRVYESSMFCRALCEHLGVWYNAQGYIGKALRVTWHLSLLPEQLICFVHTRGFNLEWTFIVKSLAHTSAINIFDQHFDQDYLVKGEVLPNRDLDRFM